jgi:hypothetical protein
MKINIESKITKINIDENVRLYAHVISLDSFLVMYIQLYTR